MTYEVLARKWRPQDFGDVIGQRHVTQTLINAMQAGRLAHAYLFAGPRGVGKTSVARILAKAINCVQGEPGKPCNQCQSCKEITSGSSVDVQEIDGASNRGIDEIRELRENINYMPSSSSYRVYIIDEVHMLTLPAFNALLKTLEEPPPHVKFIFATTEPHKVPVTILSRCQRFDFKRIPLLQIIQHLRKIADQEGISINKTGLSLIAREAEGGMRDAESLLDQVVSFAGSTVEDKQVVDILGIIDLEVLFRASGSIIDGDQKTCLEIVDQIYNYGYDIKAFYRSLMQQFRNLLVSLISRESDLMDIPESDRERAWQQAEKAGKERLRIILNFLLTHEKGLRFTTHPRLLLETIMLQLCQLGDFLSFQELLEKVERLEKHASESHPAVPSSDVPNLADPAAEWQKEGTEGTSGTSPVPHGESSWDGFLAFAASKNRPMSNILEKWRVMNLTETTLELMNGPQSFAALYFDDPEKRAQLHAYCREFFGREIQVHFLKAKNPPAVEKPAPQSQSAKKSKDTKKDVPPPVQDIMDLFQGRIIQKKVPKKPE